MVTVMTAAAAAAAVAAAVLTLPPAVVVVVAQVNVPVALQEAQLRLQQLQLAVLLQPPIRTA